MIELNTTPYSINATDTLINPFNIWPVFYSLRGNIIKNSCPYYIHKNDSGTQANEELVATFLIGQGDTLINITAKQDGKIIERVTSGSSITISPEKINGPVIIEVQATGIDVGLYNQNLLIDNLPTENSENLVRSGGVYSALDNKEDLMEISHVIPQNGSFQANTIYSLGEIGQNIIFSFEDGTNDDDMIYISYTITSGYSVELIGHNYLGLNGLDQINNFLAIELLGVWNIQQSKWLFAWRSIDL